MNLKEIEAKYGKVYYEKMTTIEILKSCNRNKEISDITDWVSGVVAIQLGDFASSTFPGHILSYKLTGIESRLRSINYKVLGASSHTGYIFAHVSGHIGEGTVREYALKDSAYIISDDDYELHSTYCPCGKCDKESGKCYSVDLSRYGFDDSQITFKSLEKGISLAEALRYAKENGIVVINI